MALVRVCDVSRWQGHFNWKAFGDAAIGGVYIKACEGLVQDPEYHTNLALCREAAMRPGAYLFLRPEVDPVKQAELLFQMAPHMPTDLTPALDVEFVKRDGVDEWLSMSSLIERAAFIMKAAQAVATRFGRLPRLYTSGSFVSEYLPANHGLGSFPLWVARYLQHDPLTPGFLPVWNKSYLPAGWTDWDMWQYGQIKLPGVGVVDASLMKA